MNRKNSFLFRLVMNLSLSFFIFLSVVASANATSIRQLNVDQLLETAELVFEGKVLESEARWVRNGSTIRTFVFFRVDEVISGDFSKKRLLLSFEGGTIDNETVDIQGLRAPKVNEKGIYFIESLGRSLVNPIVGWSQGHFLLESDGDGNDTVMTEGGMHVIDIDDEPQQLEPQGIEVSEGVVKGIQVSNLANKTRITSKRFKQALKRRMKRKQRSRNQEEVTYESNK